jgi:hypothetical protein
MKARVLRRWWGSVTVEGYDKNMGTARVHTRFYPWFTFLCWLFRVA